MMASIAPLPFHLWRTSSRAQPIPKIVLIGTAIATMTRVSFSACRPSGEVIASIGGPIPSSKVLKKISTSGARSNRAR
jgi:hypothetical protein